MSLHPSAQLGIRELREKCHNPDYDMWVNRPARLISIYVTKLFLMLGITANMTSVLGFVIFVAAFALFAWPGLDFRLLGVLLMLLAELFDYVDGELARAYGRSTKTGSFLEPFFQDIIYTLIFVSVGVSVFGRTGDVKFLYLGMAAGFGKILFRLTETRFRYHMKMNAPETVSGPEAPVGSKRFSVLSLPFKIGIIIHRYFLSGVMVLYLLLALVLLERVALFLWIYGLMLPVFWTGIAVLRVRTINRLDR